MSNAKEQKTKDRLTPKPNFIERAARLVAKVRIERFLKKWEIELTDVEKDKLTIALAKCLLNGRGEQMRSARKGSKEYRYVNNEAWESASYGDGIDLVYDEYFVGSDGEESKC